MSSQQSRILMLGGGAIIALLLIIGLVLSITSPLKPVRGFMKEVEAQKKDAALAYVKDSIDQPAKDDIAFFLDDWMTAGKPVVEIEKTDSYNIKPAEGDTALSLDPTPKYWSRNARIFLTIGFEEFDDPVMFTVERKSNGNGVFKNLFRGWEIIAIEYQPIGEDGGEEIEIGNELEEVEVLEGEDVTTADTETETDEVEESETSVTVDGDQEDPGTIEQ